MEDLLKSISVAAVAGLFGLVPALLQWAGNRGHERNRSRQLQNLRDELDFLEKWRALSSQHSDGDTNEIANSSLTRIMERYGQLNNIRESTANPKVTNLSDLSFFRRAFLFFRPQTFFGTILHSIFYFLLIAFIAFVVPEALNPTYDKEGVNETWYLIFGLLIILGLPMLLLQRGAVRNFKNALDEK